MCTAAVAVAAAAAMTSAAARQQEQCKVCVCDAVRDGEICCLTSALRQRQMQIADYDPDSRQQFTALHWACYFGKTEVSKTLRFLLGLGLILLPQYFSR